MHQKMRVATKEHNETSFHKVRSQVNFANPAKLTPVCPNDLAA